MKIYNRLAVLRAEANITRQELATAARVNVQTIGFLERGDYYPSLELAFVLAEFFQTDVTTVFATKPFESMFKKRSE